MSARRLFAWADATLAFASERADLDDEQCAMIVEALSRFDHDDPIRMRAAVEQEFESFASWARLSMETRAGRRAFADVIDAIVASDDHRRAARGISRALWTPAGRSRLVEDYESFGKAVLAAWDAPDAIERLDGLREAAREGRHGDLAAILAGEYARMRDAQSEASAAVRAALGRLVPEPRP